MAELPQDMGDCGTSGLNKREKKETRQMEGSWCKAEEHIKSHKSTQVREES
jgi:hypothetical protein